MPRSFAVNPPPLCRLVATASLVASAACGASSGKGNAAVVTDDSGTIHFTGDGGSDATGISLDGSGLETATGGEDCTDDRLKQIYVVTEGNEMYQFAPGTLKFTRIGKLNCPGDGIATPFSMAVSRSGTAWIVFNDGNVYKASTKDATCSASGYAPNQLGYSTFGMAFVSNTAGSSAETLYVSPDIAGSGKGVATIDTATLTMSYVGDFGETIGAMDLTGRGDARFFGFANGELAIPPTRTKVAEIDKTTGKILGKKEVPSVTVGRGWAFATWGGDFWLFTSPSGSSNVTQFNYDTGKATQVVTDLGYVIVGAGVSTCAPTTTIH